MAQTPPSMLADKLGPGGDRGDDPADPLGIEREGTQRHVAMLGCKGHGLHSANFGDRELARARAGTRRMVVEGSAVEFGDGLEKRRPRRCQVETVERGIARPWHSALPPARITCSRSRWS